MTDDSDAAAILSAIGYANRQIRRMTPPERLRWADYCCDLFIACGHRDPRDVLNDMRLRRAQVS